MTAKLAVIGLGILSFVSVMLQFGSPCIHLSQVDSSNNYIAKHDDIQALADGTAIMAYHQTGGRGQFASKWAMYPGKDLAVSYLIRPELNPESSYVLNKATALAVRQTISDLTGAIAYIKWPNDILIGRKKVAGILIEPVWQGTKCKHVVIGIGINVNGDYTGAEFSATSMKGEAGQEIELDMVFSLLSDHLTYFYDQFQQRNRGFLEKNYAMHLFGRERPVQCTVESDQERFKATIKGVTDHGQLLIEVGGRTKAYAHRSIAIDYSGIEG